MSITSQSLMSMTGEDLTTALWELFHENTKLSRLDFPVPTEAVVAVMAQMSESLSYETAEVTPLPGPGAFPVPTLSLADAIVRRNSARSFSGAPVTLPQLGALLYYGYGVNRTAQETGFGRAFRNAPSGGGLFPLEIYFAARAVEGLSPGLYHYQSLRQQAERIAGETAVNKALGSLMQADIAATAPVTFFITALFNRTVFKYRDRGYRFILLEAGHVAQNINLAAEAVGLASLNIGGYVDREADEALDLDGLSQSTVYVVSVGERGGAGEGAMV
ncbi:MAG: SagB/ThcOx family dehydrogenase [Nitrospinae bacterium]|nr:SagB/ThcOx family dehydrogenase [Nitrospinota bacterium]